MNKLKHLLTVCVILLTAIFTHSCSSNDDIVELSESFETPSLDSHPGAFWCWLNGSMTKERISYDLESMKAKGINRAEIWDVAATHNSDMIPAGGAFMGDKSVELIKFAISEGKRLGMSIGMVASSGWNAGGAWVTPDWASKGLYYSEMNMKGPEKVTVNLPFPKVTVDCPLNEEKTPVFYKEVAVVAVPFSKDKRIDPSKIINLKGFFSEGKLTWEVPEGEWTIIRFVCTNTGQNMIVPSPNSGGLFIDFLDPEATKRHLKHLMDCLGITPENAAEFGLDYLEFDSMELPGGTPWTDKMPEVFFELRGYAVDNYYPVLAGWTYTDNDDEKFMYDFSKTVSDRLISSHYTTGTEFLKKYGTDLVSESGGPGPPIWNSCPVDALKALGNVSVPRGEFWVKHMDIFLVKEVASAAHIYGHKYVDAESFTTWRRWLDSPFKLKKELDRAYSEGLNTVTFHTYASTSPEDGYPGRTYHAGIDINTGTTWWNKSKPFMDYITRCCEMLRKGLFVADACYYYGDKAPNFFPAIQDVPEKPRLKELSHGYDFDVVNTDVILNRMSVNEGRITFPDGMSYPLMILQDSKEMRLEVLKKIETLVEAGATVLGTKPDRIPGSHSEEDMKEFKVLTDKLWDSGKILSGMTADEALQKADIDPDFIFKGDSQLDYIHRRDGDCEIYFISNPSNKETKGTAQFRVKGKTPELWNPSTGAQYSVKDYKKDGNTTLFDLELPAYGSTFVIFSSKKRDLPEYNPNLSYKEEIISAPWSVNFDEKWGGPKEHIFDELKSWTDFKEEGIKYYSGTVAYNKTIEVKDENIGKNCSIDLGEVREVAEVFVNGKSAGIMWKYPYKVDITNLLKVGKNELKIEIVNMWANRLTGDKLLEPDERFCRTNNGWDQKELLPSGLLGPVKLMYEE